MGRGIWSEIKQIVRPGSDRNFDTVSLQAIELESSGIVVVPIKANWGPIRQLVELEHEAAGLSVYGSDSSGGATADDTLKLTWLGRPKKIVAYRMADEHAARASILLKDTYGDEVLKIETKYEGTRGNSFMITVQAHDLDARQCDIRLLEGTIVLTTFTFACGSIQAAAEAINNDPLNVWVSATVISTGADQLAAVSEVPLTGGNSGISGITLNDYISALSVFETQTFHVVALDGVYDPVIHTAVASWTARLREKGSAVITVLGGSAVDDTAADAVSKAILRSASFNHEGIVNVGTGVVYQGITYSSAQTSAYVAGLIASQRLGESITYALLPFAGVSRRWKSSEQEAALQSGVLLFYHDGVCVNILHGINTLNVLFSDQTSDWKKISTIRFIDAINSGLLRTVKRSCIGKMSNSEDRRTAMVSVAMQYMIGLAQIGVIEAEGHNVYLNPAYYGIEAICTPETDRIYLKWGAKLIDLEEPLVGTLIIH